MKDLACSLYLNLGQLIECAGLRLVCQGIRIKNFALRTMSVGMKNKLDEMARERGLPPGAFDLTQEDKDWLDAPGGPLP